MGIPAIVGLCLASVCLVLLIIALVQLSALRSALSEIDHRARQLQRAAEDGGRVDRTAPMLGNLLEQMRRLDEAVANLPLRYSSPAPASAAPSPPPSPPPPPPPPAPAERTVAIPEPIREMGGDRRGLTARAFEPFPEERASAGPTAPVPASEQVARPWMAPASEPIPAQAVASERDVEMLGEFRKLIAQPRKAEINRWTEDHQGESCEVTEEDAFRPLDRDAGGLLVLLPLGGDRAMVLPAGRLVVDFATNFANSLSLRSVTRQTFELVEDGSGVLRLIEPAYAERREGVWRLTSPGRLSGLNPG